MDISDEFIYSTEALALASLRDLLDTTAADVAFLAVNAPRARFIRAYLGTQFPIYATSLVYASSADKLELYDLDGVRFMDMPWLLQEDHPAVMTYLRAPLDSSALDEEHLGARLGLPQHHGHGGPALPLDVKRLARPPVQCPPDLFERRHGREDSHWAGGVPRTGGRGAPAASG